MLTYILLLIWLTRGFATPIKTAPLLYYAPTTSQYVQNGVYPFMTAPLGKALQSIQSPNDLVFYPSPITGTHPVLLRNQHQSRFTAPPQGLVNAIYAWFAENNIPIPPENPVKNEPEKPESLTDQPKFENLKPPTLESFEAAQNPTTHYPKKAIPTIHKSHQRYYILNGHPQYFNNYQPLVPQMLTRNALPSDTQNILILQPTEQSLKLKKSHNHQNLVLVQNGDVDSELRDQYQNAELKQQGNYVIIQESSRPENSQQHLLFGRLLPQMNELKSEVSQTPIHQTHYVPVEVVPPQMPIQTAPEETNTQHLSFIHIPVDRNVEPPQYIKSVIPVESHIPEQRNSGNQVLYLSQQLDNSKKGDEKIKKEESDESPGLTALDYARYIATHQDDFYSDSVVIDAKTDEGRKDEEDNDAGEVIQADTPHEPSIAQAQPGAIALAGVGGVAATAPRGTALVGEKGLAIASPQATAIAAPNAEVDNHKKPHS